MVLSCISFNTELKYKRERLEKTCEALISLLALLISGSLLVISWVFDKIHVPGYGPWLVVAIFWFFVVLIFTLYMRFNFVWRFVADDLEIGNGKNLVVLCWLATVMVGVTSGLFFLAVPTLRIAWNVTPPPATPPQIVQVECHMNPPAPVPTPSPTKSRQQPKHGQPKKKASHK
jgi:hypothetical protein